MKEIVSKSNKNKILLKTAMVLDYNNGKIGIDKSDQMLSYGIGKLQWN